MLRVYSNLLIITVMCIGVYLHLYGHAVNTQAEYSLLMEQ